MLAILSDEELGDKITMEQYYYNHMNKAQQAAYHSILSGRFPGTGNYLSGRGREWSWRRIRGDQISS